jgi:hypothetical protein
MYSLSFLIVELETARTTLLDVFAVANGKTKMDLEPGLSGWAATAVLPLRYSLQFQMEESLNPGQQIMLFNWDRLDGGFVEHRHKLLCLGR